MCRIRPLFRRADLALHNAEEIGCCLCFADTSATGRAVMPSNIWRLEEQFSHVVGIAVRTFLVVYTPH